MTNKGFTLVELLLVSSIISLVSSVTLSVTSTAREKARLATAYQSEASRAHALEPLLLLSLEEGSGTSVSDTSGANNTGTLVGTSWILDTPVKHAMWSLDFVNASHVLFSKPLGLTNKNFTISMWVKAHDDSRMFYTIGNLAGSNNGFAFGLSSGRVAYHIGDSSSSSSGPCGTKNVADGTWHHIAGVFDRSNLKFECHVDGRFEGAVNLGSGYLNMSDAAPRIGAIPAASFINFVGQIDDVRVYGSEFGE